MDIDGENIKAKEAVRVCFTIAMYLYKYDNAMDWQCALE